MLSLFSHLRNRNKKEMERKAADMAPEKRSELTEQIMRSGITDESTKEDMAEIERDLEHAVDLLHKAEDSEQFVGLRFHKYQEMLRARALELVEAEEEKKETDDEAMEETANNFRNSDGVEEADDGVATNTNDDEENGHAKMAKQLTPKERLVQLQKLQRDEVALFKVEQQYKTLQQTTRALKKKVFTLERRRDVLVRQTTECEDFVIAAAVVDGQAGFVVDEEDFIADDDLQRAPWTLETDMNNLNFNDGSSDDGDSDDESNSDNEEIDTRMQHKAKKVKDSNVDDDIEGDTGGSESAE